MLFDHLIDDRAWLSRMLDFPRPETFAAEGAVQLLFYVRRYCAKLLYEIEFHAAPDPTQLPPPLRRAARRRAQGRAEPDGLPRRHRLGLLRHVVPARLGVLGADDDVPARGVRQRLVQRREAGLLLTELWALGQKPTADELLKDVTGAAVEMEAVAEHVRAAIPTPAVLELERAAGGRRGAGLERRRRRPSRGRGSPRSASRCRASARRPSAARPSRRPPRAAPAGTSAGTARRRGRPRCGRAARGRDLLGHAPLLLQREPHRLDDVRERGLRRVDARDRHRLVRVEQVLDDHHRVVPLLDRLAVEVRGEPRQRLRVVVHGDRDVLLRRARTRARPARSARPGKRPCADSNASRSSIAPVLPLRDNVPTRSFPLVTVR